VGAASFGTQVTPRAAGALQQRLRRDRGPSR
jgi:hypothetical protein